MTSEYDVTPSNRVKNTGWFISHHDFGMGCDPTPLSQAQKVCSLILNKKKKKKKNLNGDHYLTCRLSPQEKKREIMFLPPCLVPLCRPGLDFLEYFLVEVD